ncbi:TPA: hypothetical protein ACGQS5_001666 [Serratia liquefaciens]
MEVDIYSSNKILTRYLAVPADSSLTGLKVVGEEFSTVSPFRKKITLEKGIIGIDPITAESDILENGYHTFGTVITVTVNIEKM